MTSQPEVEVGELWLHLTTGAAGIFGFVRGERGGPETGGNMRSHLPVGDGGSLTLFEGLDPLRYSTTTGVIVDLRYEPPGFDKHGFDWAGRSTSDVQAEAERRGWRVVTRWDAARLLTSVGYVVSARRDPEGRWNYHDALWTDQADDLTWHVPESSDGFRFVYVRHAFVYRKP